MNEFLNQITNYNQDQITFAKQDQQAEREFQNKVQPLRDTLEHHFGEYFAQVGVSLDDNLIPVACITIEYLIYYKGNFRRMLSKYQGQTPDLIFSCLQNKSFKESEELENAQSSIEKLKAQVSVLSMEKSSSDQKNYYFQTENERLQKIVDQQNRVLRKLQDRLDGVNNSSH
jgi:peptidoglycan hydrolase CwlO-like protein